MTIYLPPIHLCVHPSIHLSSISLPSVHPPSIIHLYTCPSIHSFICLSILSSNHPLSIHSPINSFTHRIFTISSSIYSLFYHSSVHPICPFTYPPISTSICPSIHQSSNPFIHSSTCNPPTHQPICPPVQCPFIHLLAYPPTCPLSIHPPVHYPSIHPPSIITHPSSYFSIHCPTHSPSTHSPTHPSFCPSVHLVYTYQVPSSW